MRLFSFSKNKYGVELLMDIASYQDIPNYFFDSAYHRCDFYEIIFFTRGNGCLLLDQQEIHIRDRTLVFISPLQVRSWRVDRAQIECHFLLFKNDFLAAFFSDQLFSFRLQFFYQKSHPLFLLVSKEKFDAYKNVLQEIQREILHYQSDSEHIIRSLLYFILIKLNRCYADYYQLSRETGNNPIAFRFKALLLKEVGRHRNVDFYCRQLSVSRVTLNKIIQQQFGISVSAMIDEFSIGVIKSLLIHHSISVKEIAGQLGFSEAQHLTRYFKHITGLTPSAFRLTYQNGR